MFVVWMGEVLRGKDKKGRRKGGWGGEVAVAGGKAKGDQQASGHQHPP